MLEFNKQKQELKIEIASCKWNVQVDKRKSELQNKKVELEKKTARSKPLNLIFCASIFCISVIWFT